MNEPALLRKLLEKNARELIGDKPKNIALLLSAGLDSTVAGLVASKLGHKIHAYTFQLGDTQSFDSKWAERTAKTLGWNWTLIKINADPAILVKDFCRLYVKAKCRSKTEFETGWPMLYLYPEIKESLVMSGLVVDGFFVLSKSAILKKLGGPHSKKIDYDKRREDYMGPICRTGVSSLRVGGYNPSGINQHLIMQEKYKLRDANVYLKPNVLDFFLGFDWNQLNKPRQKWMLAETYPEIKSLVGHRNHVNYQLAAKIPDHFEFLLTTPINFKRRKRTLDMYRDWKNYRDEGEEIIRQLIKSGFKSVKRRSLFE